MKKGYPSGSLFEKAPISIAAPAVQESAADARPIVAPVAPDELAAANVGPTSETFDEIRRVTSIAHRLDEKFCMAHNRFEPEVSIYIDGKRPLFLCRDEAKKRGAWKWEGAWAQPN